MKIPITPRRFDSWEDAKAFLADFPLTFVFRGQRRSSWGLVTSLERCVSGTNQSLEEAEQYCYKAFRRQAHHYVPAHQIPASDLEWYALMQHHGAPTRLLDWSKSPYVAAYFALEDSADLDDQYASVWAIDILWCKAIGNERLLAAQAVDHQRHIGDLFAPEYYSALVRAKCPGVFPIEPFQLNERLTVQQGLFLYPGDPFQDFESNLMSLEIDQAFAKNVHRVDIRNSQRGLALADLKRMNISRATLFPGLDGFAQSLRYDLAVRSDLRYTQKQIQAWSRRNMM